MHFVQPCIQSISADGNVEDVGVCQGNSIICPPMCFGKWTVFFVRLLYPLKIVIPLHISGLERFYLSP